MALSKTLTRLTAVGVIAAAGAGVYLAISADVRGRGPTPTGDLDNLSGVEHIKAAYTETASFPTGFRRAHGLAVGPDDGIYVAGDSAVRIFDRAGKAAAGFKTSGEPRCLAVDSDGTIYVGLADHVAVHAADGAVKANWTSEGANAIFTSVAVGPADVFVADAGNKVVLRYDKAGKLLNYIGKKDESKNMAGLLVPSPYLDAALGKDGLLRVTDPGRLRVEAYTLDGHLMGWWGEGLMQMSGFAGCCNPTDLAVLPDGRIVTSEKGVPRIKVYSEKGEFDKKTGVVAAPESFPGGTCPAADCTKGYGLDIAADRAGRIIALDPSASTVRIFERKTQKDAERK